MTKIKTAFRAACLGVICAAGISPAAAVTVGFDTIQDAATVLGGGTPGNSYSEDGFTVTGLDGIVASFATPGTALLVDAGPDFTTAVSVTAARRFNANGLSFISLGYDAFEPPEEGTEIGNVIIRGFVGTTAVGVLRLTAAIIAGTVQSVVLGPGFADIDRLEIELAYPRRLGFCGAPCGQIELDSLDLTPAPVPLPATGGMLALGGVALAGLARRRSPARG
jgi:hypothetical protein